MAVLTDGELRLLLEAIHKQTGIQHRPDQFDAIGETISQVMRSAEIDSSQEFLRSLERDDSVFNLLVEAITIGETYFFREPKHFEFIGAEVIPSLRKRYGTGHRLRAWSAACASGEEAYSLAILCHEMDQPVDILATDIAPDAIAAAQQASYRDWSFRGDSRQRIQSYLGTNSSDPNPQQQRGRQQSLSESIRSRVRFRLLNLVSDDYPNDAMGTRFLDLIFCRNVLIYFDQQTSRQIASRLIECLSPGGWLITASADLSLSDLGGITTLTNQYGTFYRRDRSQSGSDASPLFGPESPTLPEGNAVADINPGFSAATLARAWKRCQGGCPIDPPSGEGSYTASPGHETAPTPETMCQQVWAIQQRDLPAALSKCAELAELNPLAVPLHCLHARLLLDSDQVPEAAKAVQKALFLDQSAIMPHFLFGTIQIDRGEWESAGRHFATVRQMCEALSPDDLVPLSDSVTAKELTVVVDSQIAKLRNHLR